MFRDDLLAGQDAALEVGRDNRGRAGRREDLVEDCRQVQMS